MIRDYFWLSATQFARLEPHLPTANRRWKNCFSPYLYRDRNAIERMFGRVKDFRRIATRYDKLAVNFLAAVSLAATVCYWLWVWSLGSVVETAIADRCVRTAAGSLTEGSRLRNCVRSNSFSSSMA